jgi:hypothetical protein
MSVVIISGVGRCGRSGLTMKHTFRAEMDWNDLLLCFFEAFIIKHLSEEKGLLG